MKSHYSKYLLGIGFGLNLLLTMLALGSNLLLVALIVLGIFLAPDDALSDPTGPNEMASATLEVVNYSDEVICYVYISAVTAETWGNDHLNNDIIVAGEMTTFDIEPGYYDVLLLDCQQRVLLETYSLSVTDRYSLHFTGFETNGRLLQANLS